MTRPATAFPLNPEVLIYARKSTGMTREKAAKKIGTKPEKLSEWETGKALPTYPEVKKIACAYKRCTAFFLLSEPPDEPALPKDYRVVADSDVVELSSTARIAIRYARSKRDEAIRMASLLDSNFTPFTHSADLNHSPVTLAAIWREKIAITLDQQKKFKNEYDALNSWRESLEKLDVLVLQASMSSVGELRGLAIFDKILPIILLNTKDAPLPRIFSLFHEFCHILLHVSGIGNMRPNLSSNVRENKIEIFCNAFAGNFLVPQDDLISEIRSLPAHYSTTTKVQSLATKYKVSQEVACRRMLEVKAISKREYATIVEDIQPTTEKQSGSKGGGPLPHVKSVSQNGKKYVRLVYESYNAGEISIREALQQLNIKTDYFIKCRKLAFKGEK